MIIYDHIYTNSPVTLNWLVRARSHPLGVWKLLTFQVCKLTLFCPPAGTPLAFVWGPFRRPTHVLEPLRANHKHYKCKTSFTDRGLLQKACCLLSGRGPKCSETASTAQLLAHLECSNILPLSSFRKGPKRTSKRGPFG